LLEKRRIKVVVVLAGRSYPAHKIVHCCDAVRYICVSLLGFSVKSFAHHRYRIYFFIITSDFIIFVVILNILCCFPILLFVDRVILERCFIGLWILLLINLWLFHDYYWFL